MATERGLDLYGAKLLLREAESDFVYACEHNLHEWASAHEWRCKSLRQMVDRKARTAGERATPIDAGTT